MQDIFSRRCVLASLAAVAMSLGFVTSSRADHGSQAMDLWGKFVSFQDGVLTFNIASGKLAGTKSLNVPDNIPVLVYSSPGHPTMSSSPKAFYNVPADTVIEINIDSRQRILRISLGDTKPGKKKN